MHRWRAILWLAVMLVMLSGCAEPAAAQVAQIATDTPRPPAIPTDIPMTATASNTPTETLIPTVTLTRTPRPTATLRPTATERPTRTPTNTPIPSATSTRAVPTPDVTAHYTIHISGVGPHLRNVYIHGLAAGRDSTHFSKIGDCQSTSAAFLQPIDRGHYNLGEFTYLQDVIEHFAGSFKRVGPSALDSMHMDSMLDPSWANPNDCDPGENRVQCEFRLHNPSVVIIFIQPHLIGTGWQTLYHDSLTQGVNLSLQSGIIPVLSTLFGWKDHDHLVDETNRIIKQVGQEMNVPVWDFYESVKHLPYGGDRGNWHMTLSPYSNLDFSDPRNFEYAMTYRNLEALQVLDYIWRIVMY